ncbi:MAG: DUF1912 family protein [Streptococcaceae bacterium]|jgi:hypothetical protein|nr:DUF1912 family protein [Streptococcaceae bacterium]MCL2858485.1 DUF1912 family protein [Streptococcaceae bacterium]
MNDQEQFLADFAQWIDQQVQVSELAMKTAQQLAEKDDKAKEAIIRYESRLDAYQFIQGKFENYKAGKNFHDIPEGMFGKKEY